MNLERQGFYTVDEVLVVTEIKVIECNCTEKKIDYLTLVPDDEPTLDKKLGRLIECLKQFGFPVAAISKA